MGMETLNNAARAAGFAMAAGDEFLSSNTKPEIKAESEAWRPGEAVLPGTVAPPPSALHVFTSWVKERVPGIFGRGAPA